MKKVRAGTGHQPGRNEARPPSGSRTSGRIRYERRAKLNVLVCPLFTVVLPDLGW